MEKTVKIRSSFLSTLNEALQKMKLNDTVKEFTPVIVEADGKFSSIVKANDDFDPSQLGMEVDSAEETEEQKETKDQLLNKAKDSLKQTLTASSNLHDILQKIADLSKETKSNTWKVNKEGNTASLDGKNMKIFKQNNYICLSHNGKIELFHSVQELRNWLKENNYPLPDESIVIHESVEIKEEGRNWLDLLNKKKDAEKSKSPEELFGLLDQDTIDQYKEEIAKYTTEESKFKKIVDEYRDLKARQTILSNKLLSLEGIANNKEGKFKDSEVQDAKESLANYEEELHEVNKRLSKIKDNAVVTEKEYRDWKEKTSNWNKEVTELAKKLNIDSLRKDRLYGDKDQREVMNSLGKMISKDQYQFLSKQKQPEKFTSMPGLNYNPDEEVEECAGACTTTAGLGAGVGYLASKPKKEDTLEEEELVEAGFNYIPDGKGGYTSNVYAQKGKAAKAFLSWLSKDTTNTGKTNLEKIFDGEIILPSDFKDRYENEISPAISEYFISDSFSPAYNELVRMLSKEIGNKKVKEYLAKKKITPSEEQLIRMQTVAQQEEINNPSQEMVDRLTKNLNSALSDKYALDGEFVAGKPLMDTKNKNPDENPNYELRRQWCSNACQTQYDADPTSGVKIQKRFRDLHALEDLIDQMSAEDFSGFKSKEEREKEELNKPLEKDEIATLKANGINPNKLPSVAKARQILATLSESVKKYPWLNKILGTRLVEDDSPADFATGSPISSDMDSSDISTDTTTTTSTETPDFDISSDIPADTNKSFGDINISTGGYSPDVDEEEDLEPLPNMPDYKIIDVLMNDDNPDDIKVKVQDMDTKKTEIKDLSDIDV